MEKARLLWQVRVCGRRAGAVKARAKRGSEEVGRRLTIDEGRREPSMTMPSLRTKTLAAVYLWDRTMPV
jgi:hypothetical protein